jgi:thioredoxin reductase (NADPH)
VSCQAVVVTTGVSYRQLDVPGAAELAGAGVYYGAATTESFLYRDLPVAVIGSGNSAGQATVHLSRFASRVHLVIRGGDLGGGMSTYLVDQIGELGNVELHTHTEAARLLGESHLQAATFTTPAGELELELSAMFIFIGQQPRTAWLDGVVARDPRGFVLTGPSVTAADGWNLDREPLPLESSLPGVFAAGDVRHDSIKRIASAVGEGAMAVDLVHRYLARL